MYDVLCECDDCKKRIGLGESTFQTEIKEKQGAGAVTATGTLTGTDSSRNTPKQPPSLRQRIDSWICRIVGHDWDEFECYRCKQRLNIVRIPTKVRRA